MERTRKVSEGCTACVERFPTLGFATSPHSDKNTHDNLEAETEFICENL
jgi:hypothetical protein